MSSEPVSSKIVLGVIRPSSSAAVAVILLLGMRLCVEGRVVSRVGAHPEDGAAVDVHRDESARQPPRAQRRFADLLQAGVQCQAQVVAGLRGPVAERPAGSTERVDLDPLTAGGAA